MKVNTTEKHLVSITENILNSEFNRNDSLSPMIYLVKPDGRVVARFNETKEDPIEHFVLDCQFDKAIFPMELIQETKQGDVKFCLAPITFHNDIIGFIAAYHRDKSARLISERTYLLSQLISFQFTVTRRLEKLHLNSELHHAITEAVSHGFLTIDKFGVVTYLNRQGAQLLNV